MPGGGLNGAEEKEGGKEGRERERKRERERMQVREETEDETNRKKGKMAKTDEKGTRENESE